MVVNGYIEEDGKYHVLIHYKLTAYIKSKGEVRLFTKGVPLTIYVSLTYCPAVDGCRIKVNAPGFGTISYLKGVASVMLDFPRQVQIVSTDFRFLIYFSSLLYLFFSFLLHIFFTFFFSTSFQNIQKYIFFFQENVLLVKQNSLSLEVMKPFPGHKIEEFLRKCSKSNFYTNPNQRPHLVCLSGIFTMTLSFLGYVPKCNCDRRGSTSLRCKSFGGQCMCRRNVVGRRCNQCPIGYSGFPLCRSEYNTQFYSPIGGLLRLSRNNEIN